MLLVICYWFIVILNSFRVNLITDPSIIHMWEGSELLLSIENRKEIETSILDRYSSQKASKITFVKVHTLCFIIQWDLNNGLVQYSDHWRMSMIWIVHYLSYELNSEQKVRYSTCIHHLYTRLLVCYSGDGLNNRLLLCYQVVISINSNWILGFKFVIQTITWITT